MKVCIAEKPSVAKELANILGAQNRKDGYFEGNGYQITWTFGHLCTLQEPHDYNSSLKRWDLNTLPIIPRRFKTKLITNKGVKKQFDTIKSLVNNAEEVINCGDAGQEGELIQRWVLQMAGCTKPMKRLWVSSLTEEALKKGFQNLKDASEYDSLYHAGSSRAIGDWLLGINGTRLYTLKYGGNGVLLSIGRVQTPTLAMIVDRYQEIQNFVSKPFWELKTMFKNARFSAIDGKFYEEDKANESLVNAEGYPFTIKEVEKKDGKESAPKLFDLTSLQVECNKKLNLSAEDTLKITQTLYERKYVTYPRVDTRYLPDDQYDQIEGILKSMSDYQALVAPLLGKEIRKSKNVFNDKKVTDHHAIIPTNVTARNLAGRDLQVYQMIAKRFIANFYPDCLVAKTTVIGESNNVKFKATGKVVTSVGWREVYGAEDNVDEEDDKSSKDGEIEDNQLLPDFSEGESGPHEPYLEQKETSPPKLFTEATLLRGMETAGKQVDDEDMRELMKENGIGRASTRANIIETLFRRKYIVRQRKNIVPTPAGEQLIGTIQSDLLKSPELTGAWEKRLRQIEKKEYDVLQFFREMHEMVSGLVNDVKNDRGQNIKIEQKDTKVTKPTKKTSSKSKDIKCPKCNQGKIMKGKSAFGCSRFKDGCDFVLKFEQHGKKLSDSQMFALIGKGKTPTIKGLEISGEKKDAILILNKNLAIEVHAKESKPLVCPQCKEGTMLKGKAAYGCNRFKLGCRTVIPFEVHGKKLTSSQIEALILKGKTGKIKGFNLPDKPEGVLHLNQSFQIEVIN